MNFLQASQQHLKVRTNQGGRLGYHPGKVRDQRGRPNDGTVRRWSGWLQRSCHRVLPGLRQHATGEEEERWSDHQKELCHRPGSLWPGSLKGFRVSCSYAWGHKWANSVFFFWNCSTLWVGCHPAYVFDLPLGVQFFPLKISNVTLLKPEIFKKKHSARSRT